MKFEDLMINDYVVVKEPDKYLGFIGVVRNIGVETNCITLHVPLCNTDVFVEDVEGIPITSEFLEKNGFRKIHDSVENTDNFMCNYFPFFLVESKKLWWTCTYDSSPEIWNLFPIQYVHELQHAIKLCGQDRKLVI